MIKPLSMLRIEENILCLKKASRRNYKLKNQRALQNYLNKNACLPLAKKSVLCVRACVYQELPLY